MRGVGWAVAYQNPENRLVSNHWITLHNDGHPPGFKPIVVMDAWEHAFVPDHKPTERAKYIEAYFKTLDWRACEARLIKETTARAARADRTASRHCRARLRAGP